MVDLKHIPVNMVIFDLLIELEVFSRDYKNKYMIIQGIDIEKMLNIL